MEKGASKSKWWWIGSHNTSDLSPWLQSTISELDAKTKEMLRVIEEEADSFAERAEMYYRKRPELIAMVEDLYRTYRSLAEKYDVARSSSLLHKHAPPEKSIHVPEALEESTYNEESWMIQVPESPEKPVHVPVSPEKSILVPKALERSNSDEESWMLHVPDTPGKSTHVPETPGKSTYEESWAIHVPKTPERSTSKRESWSYASEIEEYEESEVDDGESSVDDAVNGDEGEGEVESMIDDAEAMMRMKEELDRLREENRASSELLRQKDEEKREAIRQLSLALEMIKEENLELKKCVSVAAKQKQMSPKKQLWSPFQFKKLKEGFLGNFALGF